MSPFWETGFIDLLKFVSIFVVGSAMYVVHYEDENKNLYILKKDGEDEWLFTCRNKEIEFRVSAKNVEDAKEKFEVMLGEHKNDC